MSGDEDVWKALRVSIADWGEHVRTCSRPRCLRCRRETCSRCGAAPAEMGQVCWLCRRTLRWHWLVRDIGIPPRFAWARLGASELAQRCGGANVVGQLAVAAYRCPRALALVGDSGSGKTSAAAALIVGAAAFDFAFDGVPAHTYVFDSAIELAREASHIPTWQGEAARVTRAKEAGVLMLDEIGREDERQRQTIVEIIHARHDAERPTWITTGLVRADLGGRYGGGVLRRLFEDAVVIRCTGSANR